MLQMELVMMLVRDHHINKQKTEKKDLKILTKVDHHINKENKKKSSLMEVMNVCHHNNKDKVEDMMVRNMVMRHQQEHLSVTKFSCEN